MKRFACVAVVLAACAVAGAPLFAQNLSGTWTLHTSAFLPNAETPCTYEGTVELTSGPNSQWTGPATLSLVSGPEGCPAEMMADCTGALDGGTFGGRLDGGDLFGMASFTGTQVAANQIRGTISSVPTGERSNATLATKAGWQGGFTTESGPYAGGSGTFVAVRQSVLEIPTLTETGLLIMAILLLATATYYLMRRRQQTL